MRSSAILLVLLLLIPGCITFYGEATTEVRLLVTEEMGTTVLEDANLTVADGSSVMDVLRQVAQVETAYGGGFVQAIDGQASRYPDDRVDWFYHVDGQLSPVGAADRAVDDGDVVVWDYRPWNHTNRLPVVFTGLPAWPGLLNATVQPPSALNATPPDQRFVKVVDSTLVILDPWHKAATRIQPPWLLAHATATDGEASLLLVASGPEAQAWTPRLQQVAPTGLGVVLTETGHQAVPA